jgi:hypothetical protein
MTIDSSPPSRRKMLKRYFFPMQKPESPGCLPYMFGMVGNTEHKKLTDKYEQDRSRFYELLGKWELVEDELLDLPNSEQIDTWLQENLDNIRHRGLDKLGLSKQDLLLPEEFSELISTKAVNPMQIYGPLLTTITTIPAYENVFVLRRGKIRFSCYEVMLVALTKSRIATDTCHFNFVQEAIVQESAKEFLYHDVVSVSTEEQLSNYTFSTGETLSVRRQFKLAVASGDNIVVSVASPEIRQKLGADPNLSNHDESVRAIREMMRTKKDKPASVLQRSLGDDFQKAPSDDPVIKLSTLKNMLDTGLITEEEFNNKKADILSKM